jgi:hypothetical protein
MPVSGSFGVLEVNVASPSGGGTTVDYTLVINGAQVAGSCSITDPATSCQGGVPGEHPFSVGDTVELQLNEFNTTSANLAPVTWAIQTGP